MRFLLFGIFLHFMSGVEFGTQNFVVSFVQFIRYIGYRQFTMDWTKKWKNISYTRKFDSCIIVYPFYASVPESILIKPSILFIR